MNLHLAALAFALFLVLFNVRVVSEAQPARKVWRIGYLTTGLCLPPGEGGLSRQAFQELGYVEGRDVVLECRKSDGTAEKYRALAAELVSLNVDVIVAVSSRAVRAARAATQQIPIVAIDLETDPVASGLAVSLARPGANVTGIFLNLPELSGKRLELLRETVPGLARVAILWDSALDATPLRATEEAARALGLQLHVVPIRQPSDFDAGFATAMKTRAQALMVMQSPVTDVHGKLIADLALKYRLPAAAIFPEFVEKGGLTSYGPDVRPFFRQAVVSFVDKILKGARAGALPIERPTHYYLAVNLKTAKALGLAIPQSVLVRADRIIE